MARGKSSVSGRQRKPSKSVVWFSRRGADVGTKHNWPSNFFIEPDGTHVEGEYQAAKHEGYPWRQIILLRVSPSKAKRLGREWRLSKEELRKWDKRKRRIMRELLEDKVDDWEFIEEALLATGDGDLVEENWWHDNDWGNCTCARCHRIGHNWLGQAWMEVRNTLQEEEEAD